MAILLVRHGETASNVDRIVQVPETPLNERGRLQAELLAARLEQFQIAAVLVSDLARAVMTAQPLAERGLPVEADGLLQERNFGDLRGRSYASIGRDIFADDYEPPAGESWETFHRRVDAAWRRVGERARDLGGDLAVVTHGLVCRSLASRHWRLPSGSRAPERWGNTSLTIIEAESPWSVSLLNCTHHLVGEARDGDRLSGL